jgi:hypothetical protein
MVLILSVQATSVVHLLLEKSNAAAQARQTAGARDERTLFAVACSRLLGKALVETVGRK